MKRCWGCHEEKPLSEFWACRWSGDKRQRECKTCCRTRKHKWHQTEIGKASSANTKLKARFGLTLGEYEKMCAAVGNRCEVCGAEKSDHGHRLAIDHDHATGAIRGILCKSCNVAIGRFNDDTDRMARAIEYLNKHGRLRAVGT